MEKLVDWSLVTKIDQQKFMHINFLNHL